VVDDRQAPNAKVRVAIHELAHGNPFAGRGAIEPTAGQALLLSKHQLTRLVLHSDAIDIYPGGRRDIAAGHVDRRVLATLVFLERSGLKPTVSCLITGHSLYTTSGNISAHSYGHAADISAINGVPIVGQSSSPPSGRRRCCGPAPAAQR